MSIWWLTGGLIYLFIVYRVGTFYLDACRSHKLNYFPMVLLLGSLLWPLTLIIGLLNLTGDNEDAD